MLIILGGRMIGAILPDISREFLTRMMEGTEIAGVTVRTQGADFGSQGVRAFPVQADRS